MTPFRGSLSRLVDFPIASLFEADLKCSYQVLKRRLGSYRYFAIHVFTASWTARDRSPFFPPNLSTVLNLSCFSSSSGRSTLIRPIFNLQLLVFFHGLHVSSVFPARQPFNNVFAVFSKLPTEYFHVCFDCHSFIHPQPTYKHKLLYAYTLMCV